MKTLRVWTTVEALLLLVGTACIVAVNGMSEPEAPWWGPREVASDRLSINGIYLGTQRIDIQKSLPESCHWMKFNGQWSRALVSSGVSQVLISFEDSSPEARVVAVEAESESVLRLGSQIIWRNGGPAFNIQLRLKEGARPLTYAHGDEAVRLITLWNGQVVAVQLERSAMRRSR